MGWFGTRLVGFDGHGPAALAEKKTSMPSVASRAYRLLTLGLAAVLLAGLVVSLPTSSLAAAPSQQTSAAATATTSDHQTVSNRYPGRKTPPRTWTPNNVEPGASTVDNPGPTQGACGSTQRSVLARDSRSALPVGIIPRSPHQRLSPAVLSPEARTTAGALLMLLIPRIERSPAKGLKTLADASEQLLGARKAVATVGSHHHHVRAPAGPTPTHTSQHFTVAEQQNTPHTPLTGPARAPAGSIPAQLGQSAFHRVG